MVLSINRWGKISDRYGRRIVILVGLIGNGVTTCLFGLSQTLVWAILMRSCCGLLNGNIGVAKAVVGELTQKVDPKLKGTAFSLIGLSFGFFC